jgi:hypothetical protein
MKKSWMLIALLVSAFLFAPALPKQSAPMPAYSTHVTLSSLVSSMLGVSQAKADFDIDPCSFGGCSSPDPEPAKADNTDHSGKKWKPNVKLLVGMCIGKGVAHIFTKAIVVGYTSHRHLTPVEAPVAFANGCLPGSGYVLAFFLPKDNVCSFALAKIEALVLNQPWAIELKNWARAGGDSGWDKLTGIFQDMYQTCYKSWKPGKKFPWRNKHWRLRLKGISPQLGVPTS